MYTYVYTGSLQTLSYIQSSHKPWGNPLSNHNLITYTTTKKVTLNTSRHTLFLANTPTLRLLILIPSRTHNQSQQTHKQNLFSRVQGLHLLQKIIWNQYKQNPIPQTLINHKLSAISALWKTQKLLAKNLSKINSQICFFEYIQRCSLLSNLNKLLNCIKRLVKAFNDWSVSS